MFAARYWNARHWNARYWSITGTAEAAAPKPPQGNLGPSGALVYSPEAYRALDRRRRKQDRERRRLRELLTKLYRRATGEEPPERLPPTIPLPEAPAEAPAVASPLPRVDLRRYELLFASFVEIESALAEIEAYMLRQAAARRDEEDAAIMLLIGPGL